MVQVIFKRTAAILLIGTLVMSATNVSPAIVFAVEQGSAPEAPPEGGGGPGGADTMIIRNQARKVKVTVQLLVMKTRCW